MMSNGRYTVVLKCLMDDQEVRPLLDKALSTYPLYEKKSKEEFIPSIVPTREQLNSKILNAYKYREIGFETIARFLDELEISMNEIMPYYNQLLFSADQDYNILFNVDYQRTTTTDREGSHSQETSGETSATTSGTDNTSTTTLDSQNTETTTTENSETNATVNHTSKNVKSSTPQSELSVTAANIDSVSYADEVNWNKDTNSDQATTQGTSTGNTTSSGTGSNETTGEHSTSGSGSSSETSTGSNTEKETMLETTKGNFGVMATQDLITKYRELIINIEQQIINDERISELFMRVY